MKAALFSNQLSRYNRIHAGRVSASARELAITEHVLDTATLNTPPLLDIMLKRHVDAGGNTLIINGGDGTLDFIIARLRNEALSGWRPDIILLRGGTTNMTHRDVGYGHDPAQALACAMRRDRPWLKIQRDVMCLRGANLLEPQYGFFFGTHALARAIHHARHTLHTRGMHGTVGEALLFATTLAALLRGNVHSHPILAPTLLSYTRHGSAQKAEHVFFIATTLQRLLLGMRAAQPKAGELGCISIVTPTHGLWRQLPSLWRGVPNQSSGTVLRWCDTRVELALTSEVALDGELFRANAETPLTLGIDSAVTFLT